jgi:hypothetical protein
MAFSLHSERVMTRMEVENSRVVGILAGFMSFCSGFHRRNRSEASRSLR